MQVGLWSNDNGERVTTMSDDDEMADGPETPEETAAFQRIWSDCGKWRRRTCACTAQSE
jgi:hypothetical protein